MILCVLALLLLLFLFIKSKEKCLIILTVWFPTLSILMISQVSVWTVMVFLYLFSSLYSTVKSFKSFPFKWAFIICAVSFIGTNFVANHPRLLVNNLSYYVLPVILWSYSKDKMYALGEYYIRHLMIYLAIISIYGLVEAITASNPFMNYLNSSGVFSAEQSEDYFRFGLYRARSLTHWCSAYGSVCALNIFLLLHLQFNNIVNLSMRYGYKYYLLLIALFLSVFACGTRSIFTMFLIGLLSLVPLFFKKIGKAMLYIIPVFCVVLYFHEYFFLIVDSLINHEETGGSSMELRYLQFESAWSYFIQKPVWGWGLGYGGIAANEDYMLYGLESIVLKVMIDRGAVGLLSVLILWLSLLWYTLKSSHLFLCFIIIGFATAKILSALLGIPETYIFFIIIPLFKFLDTETN